jgi:hypothetical protein
MVEFGKYTRFWERKFKEKIVYINKLGWTKVNTKILNTVRLSHKLIVWRDLLMRVVENYSMKSTMMCFQLSFKNLKFVDKMLKNILKN